MSTNRLLGDLRGNIPREPEETTCVLMNNMVLKRGVDRTHSITSLQSCALMDSVTLSSIASYRSHQLLGTLKKLISTGGQPSLSAIESAS